VRYGERLGDCAGAQARDADAIAAEFAGEEARKPSTPADEVPLPRKPAPLIREPGVDNVRIPPRPRERMCRAATRAARKFVRA